MSAVSGGYNRNSILSSVDERRKEKRKKGRNFDLNNIESYEAEPPRTLGGAKV